MGSALAFGACNESSPTPASEPLGADFKAVLSQVANIRGIEPPEGLEAGALAREDVRETLADSLTSADREAFERMTALYRLLGFIGKGDDYEEIYLDFASRALIGFYEPARDSLRVVNDQDRLDFQSFDATLRGTVAHEFVHALQDARFDLAGLLERAASDLDWSLALSAVLEGDAVQHERLWAMEHLPGSDVSGTPVRGVGTGGIPAAIERELRWPYEGGLDWVSLAGMANGNAQTNAVLSGERITTAEILHPELRGSGWRAEEVSMTDLSPALGDGWMRASGGSFGEFRLRNLLQLHLGGLPSVAAAQGWNGDRYDVYQRGGESLAVVLVDFAAAGEAEQFSAAMVRWFDAASAEMLSAGEEIGTLPDGRGVALAQPGPDRLLLIFGSSLDAAESALTAFRGG